MGPTPLPIDRLAQQALEHKLAGLSLSPVEGASWSPLAEKASARYILEPNEPDVRWIAFDFARHKATVTVCASQGEYQVVCGSGEWIRGTSVDERGRPQKVAASGAWIAEDTYTIVACLYETPFRPTITCHFEGDQLTYAFKANVGFGPLERPPLIGHKG
jgi:hypothetical protein